MREKSSTDSELSAGAEEPHMVWGEVILDEPLVGATIKIFDPEGNRLYEEKNATYVTGSFLFTVQTLPKDFLIVAEKGTLNKKPFTGKATKQVHNHNQKNYYKLTQETEPRKTHPLQTTKSTIPDEETPDFFDNLGENIAAYIGKGIANGMLSYAKGKGLGWVFHLLGKKNEITMQDLSKQLTHIQKSVDHVESLQIHTLNKIDALTSLLTDVYKGLKWENEIRSLQARSSTIVTTISDPLSKIKTTLNYLERYAKQNPAKINQTIANQINKTIDEILSPLNGIEPQLETLHNNIIGTLGEKGILEAWSTLIALGAKNNNLNDLYNAFQERFSYLLGMELTGINAMIDAYHGKHGEDTNIAKDFWTTWKTKITQQIDLFLRQTEKIVTSRIDTITGKGINPLAYSPPVDPDQQYTTSPILQKTDQFSQTLINSLEGSNAPLEAFITLRILNYPNTTQKLPPNPNIQLQETTANKTYSAISTKRKDGTTVPDKDFKAAPFELAYYKFQVPLGTYQIKNAKDNLPNLLRPQDYTINTTVTDASKYASIATVAFTETLKIHSELHKGPLIKAVDVDADGNIYILELNNTNYNHIIIKLDPTGKVITQFVTAKLPKGTQAMAVDKTGNSFYIIDQDRNIKKLDQNGNFVTDVGRQGGGIGEYKDPTALTVDSGGYVYVTDARRHKVLKFETNGRFLTEYGQELKDPHGIAVDDNGNIYIADRRQIQNLDQNGRHLTSWGNFALASSVAVDTQGQYLYVSDLQTGLVQKFSLEGEFINKITIGKAFLIEFDSTLSVDSTTGTLYLLKHIDPIATHLQAWFAIVFVSRNW